jgi:hypothetical protein
VFADELRHIKRDQISLSLLINGDPERRVHISAMAWSALVSHLKRYEIIDVHVHPEKHHDVDGPPEYHMAVEVKAVEPTRNKHTFVKGGFRRIFGGK